jgi:hypothetical protein
MAQMHVTYTDYSNEQSNIKLPFGQVTAGGAEWDGIIAGMSAVRSAIDAITLCDESKAAFYEVQAEGLDIPTNPEAQREKGLRVFYVDDSNNRKFNFTIPGPDLSALELVQGTDIVPLTGTLMAALVTQLESELVSPDGNTITVYKATVVGRRS